MFKRRYLIRWPWLSVFLNGIFCKVEIDVRIFNVTHTYQFFTLRGFYNHFSSKIVVYEVSDSKPRGNNIDIYI